MNSGQPPRKIQVNPQLKIKANSYNEFRTNPPEDSSEPFSWKLRPTLTMNSGQTPQKDSSEPFSWKLRPTLTMNSDQPPQKIQMNPSAEN